MIFCSCFIKKKYRIWFRAFANGQIIRNNGLDRYSSFLSTVLNQIDLLLPDTVDDSFRLYRISLLVEFLKRSPALKFLHASFLIHLPSSLVLACSSIFLIDIGFQHRRPIEISI